MGFCWRREYTGGYDPRAVSGQTSQTVQQTTSRAASGLPGFHRQKPEGLVSLGRAHLGLGRGPPVGRRECPPHPPSGLRGARHPTLPPVQPPTAATHHCRWKVWPQWMAATSREWSKKSEQMVQSARMGMVAGDPGPAPQLPSNLAPRRDFRGRAGSGYAKRGGGA